MKAKSIWKWLLAAGAAIVLYVLRMRRKVRVAEARSAHDTEALRVEESTTAIVEDIREEGRQEVEEIEKESARIDDLDAAALAREVNDEF